MSAGRRALLVTMDFPPTRGGIQTMAREILARAAATEFRVVAPADPGSEEADVAHGIYVRRARSVTPGRRGFIPAIALAARAEIRSWRPDVVLALHALAAPGPLTSRVPVVLACHGGELRSARIARVARWAFPRAGRIVANSRFTRSEAVALGADPMRTHVLPVGAPEPSAVAPERVAALRDRLGGGRVVLSVARLEPHKGHDRLIAALPSLPTDVRLVLVGEGSARAELQAAAAAADVSGRVVFAGSVGEEDLPAYFAAADAFALVSRATRGERAGVEGGGIALLEACAYGLPVIAGASGGVPETIRDGENGVLVNPEDPAAIGRAIRRVLDDGAFAARLSQAGRAMASGERSWGKFVERLETILDMAAGRSADGAA